MTELATAIIAFATFFVFWTVTVLGGAAYISKQLKTTRDEILQDFNSKHEANNRRYEALNTLVIRHDTWLNPDFSRVKHGSSFDQHG